MATSKRVINFSPGPAKMPLEVLEKIQQELLSWQNTGVSIMEMSHRCADFGKIIKDAEASLRELLYIPDNYKVLFMHAGAVGQFSAIPLNLAYGKTADYIVTGSWSAKAAKEAAKYCKVNLVFPKPAKFTGIPEQSTWNRTSDAAYLYYCDNETVEGVEFNYIPDSNGVPLVCDMSSNILSRPVDVSKFGIIYGGTQKNVGCAGVTIVIIREDLIGNVNPVCPSIFDYKQIDDNGSLLNTISTTSVYVAGLVLNWIKAKGGLESLAELAQQKSQLIYDVIDSSDNFYSCAVNKRYRSRINICFRIGRNQPSDKLEKSFLDEAAKQNMIQLKGHRSVGGIRVSLYNAMTIDECKILVQHLKNFLKANS